MFRIDWFETSTGFAPTQQRVRVCLSTAFYNVLYGKQSHERRSFMVSLFTVQHPELLGIVTKKDVLRHIAELERKDPNTIQYN